MGMRNRECYLCGEKYLYCPTCSQDKTKPAWMSEFHSEDCKNIFDICTRFNMKLMTKMEAQEALKACDISKKENFKSYVQHDLDVIFEEEPIIVTVETEIKEASQDKTVIETSVKGSKKKQRHEVVIKKEDK